MTSLPKTGDTIGGKYRVIRQVGEGGMGAVFEAEHVLTKKRVAVKWLQPQAARHEEATARLVREAQASARVRHPNVVDVYDVEREGESIFLVMEYLEGESLTRILKHERMPMHRLIALLVPAMRGVAAAHKQGVVHRDIKPDNILLAREQDAADPVPKILDFGISKVEPLGSDQLSLTRTGSTMGTPMYMSYEQLSGVRDIDGRTDVYAFGVILYEALTGHPPFEAETFSELVVKVATQLPAPPRTLRPEIPTRLAEVVMDAMARQRDERIQSMDELIRQLTPFATAEGFRAHMTVVAALPEARAPEHLGATGATVELAPALSSATASGPATAARATLPRVSGRRPRMPGVLLLACVALSLGFGALWWWTRGREAPSAHAPRPPSAFAPTPPVIAPAAAVPAAASSPEPGAADWEAPQPEASPVAQPLSPTPNGVLPQASERHPSRKHERSSERAKPAAPTSGNIPASRPEAKPSMPAPEEKAPASPPSAAPTPEPRHRVNREPTAEEF